MEGWEEQLSEYFAALDPQERLERLDGLRGGDEALLRWCRRLWEARYRDPNRPGQTVDRWLLRCVTFPVLYDQRRRASRGLRKAAAEAVTELFLDRPLSGPERRALELEFRNTARRYLSTCSDPRYASRLLGLRKATPAQQRERACEDIWKASRGIARAAGAEEALRPWCDALYDALLAYDPKAKALYEALDRSFRG